MGGLSWADFTAKLIAVANSSGHDYIAKATHPAPEASKIDVWYSIPVEQGNAGYVTQYSQRYEF